MAQNEPKLSSDRKGSIAVIVAQLAGLTGLSYWRTQVSCCILRVMPGNVTKAAAISGISIIVVAIIVGPLFAPPEFSWLRHSTSEQAGQHVAGAWIMRAGFVGYGLGTLIGALYDWRTRPYVRIALAVFGLGLVGTAIWSNASIVPGTASDMFEDQLHSIASGIVGTAFAATCAARLFMPAGSRRDTLAWVGLLVSVAIPVAMGALPEYRGLLQRLMFVFSFVLVAQELGLLGDRPVKNHMS